VKTPPELRRGPSRLLECAPHLEQALTVGGLPPRKFDVSTVTCETVMVPMRDGVHLATDVYRPPIAEGPVVVVRTPYDRMSDERGYVASLFALAGRGYFVISQDVRGTGQSEPDTWDYYIFEPEDGWDCIEWVSSRPGATASLDPSAPPTSGRRNGKWRCTPR
jgi:hypothetical protein